MKVFTYKGRRYTRIFPRPKIYNSQTVRDVTNRGDIFAMNVDTCEFTIIPGKARLEVVEMGLRRLPSKQPVKSKQLILL